MSQISLADLNAADEANFIEALANVVEYSPWIAEQLAAKRRSPAFSNCTRR